MSIKYFEPKLIIRNPHQMGAWEKRAMGIEVPKSILTRPTDKNTDVGILWKAMPISSQGEFGKEDEKGATEFGSRDAVSEIGLGDERDEIGLADERGAASEIGHHKDGGEIDEADEDTTEFAIQFTGTKSQQAVVLLRAAIVTILDSRTDPADEDKYEARVWVRFLNRFLQDELVDQDFFDLTDAVATADVPRKINAMFGGKFLDRNIFDPGAGE